MSRLGMTDDEEAFSDGENYGYAEGYAEGYQVSAAELREKIAAGMEVAASAEVHGSDWQDAFYNAAVRIRAGEFG